MDYQYRFNGEVLKMRITHKKTGAKDVVELYEYAYDHVGRKTSFTHNSLVVAKYEYDGIGRLINKKFRPAATSQVSKQTGNWTDASSWLSGVFPLANDNVTISTGHTLTIPSGQIASAGTLNDRGTLRNFGTLNMGKAPSSDLYVQSFSHHIRGSLRGINLDANGNLTNKLFSMKLGYETDDYYDGNIGKQTWKSSIDNVSRSFTYTYDMASRITQGTYAGTGTENYSLNTVTYDLNGNIKTLSRNGWRSNNTFGLVDNLKYTYQSNSNKIQKVEDLSNETTSFNDSNGATDYTYALDGSLTSDANKGITVIEYNYLKKPKKITFLNAQTIEYQYDASGNKLREKDKLGIWTDYAGNKIYKNEILYQIGIDEGRINSQNEYEYGIQDHLGNVRVMFRDSLGIAKITQIENFGVWGESLSKLNYYRTATNKQQFVYTGHERNEELGVFDAKARVYDLIISRFWQQDIKSEKFPPHSNYSYAANNPILFNDINGEDWTIDFTRNRKGQWQININFTGAVLNSSNQDVNVQGYINDQRRIFNNIYNGVKGNIKVNANFNVRAISDKSELKSNEHLIEIVPKGVLRETDNSLVAGDSHYGGKYVRINPSTLNQDGTQNYNNFGADNILSHEIGHTGGLLHPFDFYKSNEFIDGSKIPSQTQKTLWSNPEDYNSKNNFMDYNSRTTLLIPNKSPKYLASHPGVASWGQIMSILIYYKSGKLNQNDIPK